MKKIIVLTIVVLATGFSNVFAQVTPPGASDKDLRDTNIKGRSNELERIDRDAKKEASKKKDKSLVKPADYEVRLLSTFHRKFRCRDCDEAENADRIPSENLF